MNSFSDLSSRTICIAPINMDLVLTKLIVKNPYSAISELQIGREWWVFARLVFIKKDTLAQLFSCEFCKISVNTFLTEHLEATASFLSKISLVIRPRQ